MDICLFMPLSEPASREMHLSQNTQQRYQRKYQSSPSLLSVVIRRFGCFADNSCEGNQRRLALLSFPARLRQARLFFAKRGARSDYFTRRDNSSPIQNVIANK